MTGKCLVVERDPIWAKILRDALSSRVLELQSKVVTEPEDALEELQNGSYDLVTLDLSLDPEKRFAWGKTLLASVKSMGLSVPPIVVVSGTEEAEDFVDCINDYHELVFHFARKSPWSHLKFLDAIKNILGRSRASGLSAAKQVTVLPVFLSHTGRSPALDKLVAFLKALRVPYLIAEDEAAQGRSVKTHVSAQMAKCSAAIVLKNKDTSRSVLIEQGQVEERFPGRVAYLVEKGTSEGPLELEQVHESFATDNLESAFIYLARELKSYGYLGE